MTKAVITSECGFAAFCCNRRDYNPDVASNCFAKSGKASTGQQNKPRQLSSNQKTSVAFSIKNLKRSQLAMIPLAPALVWKCNECGLARSHWCCCIKNSYSTMRLLQGMWIIKRKLEMYCVRLKKTLQRPAVFVFIVVIMTECNYLR